MLTFLSEIFNEQRCVYCKSPYPKKDEEHYALCPQCSKHIHKMKSGYCKNCGSIQISALQDEILTSCDICEAEPVPWTHITFFCDYGDIIQEGIRQMKFHENLIYIETFARMLLPLFEEIPPFDYLVPMPLHSKKLALRGYSQCLEIAKRLNKLADIPFENKALYKEVHTVAQSSLSREARLKNVKNSFYADKTKVKDKTILLFDDVSTTGATLRAASHALLKAQAKEVFVLYIAGANKFKNQ